MNNSMKLVGALTALALVAAPISPAMAYGYRGGYHHGGPGAGLILGLLGIGAAVGYAATAVVAAPFEAIGDAVQPTYAAPVYPQQQVVYQQPVYQQPVYASAPAYYAQPTYVAAPAYPVYYGGYGYYHRPHYYYPY